VAAIHGFSRHSLSLAVVIAEDGRNGPEGWSLKYPAEPTKTD